MAHIQGNFIEKTLSSVDQFSNKADIRRYILQQWILEEPERKYRYFTETLSGGNKIYLERPTNLNKGCDFRILIEGFLLFKNGNDKPPKHDDILNDLKEKKQNYSEQQYQKLIDSIADIYECKPFEFAYTKLSHIPEYGYNHELVLKLLRWFFIEQDVTYWLKSGRAMLYNVIRGL